MTLVGFILISCNSTKKSESRLVSFITSSDLTDSTLAQIKGSLLTANPGIRIVDISQDFSTANMLEASYLLDKSVCFFPTGTLFLVLTQPVSKEPSRLILLQTQANNFYLGPDNGILTHVIERELVHAVVELSDLEEEKLRSPGSMMAKLSRIITPLATELNPKVNLSSFGPKLKEMVKLKTISPTVLGTKTNGLVVHIDRSGNVITNIKSDHLATLAKGKLLKLFFKGKTISLPFLTNQDDTPKDRLFCFINPDGELQISILNLNAASVHGLKVGDSFTLQN